MTPEPLKRGKYHPFHHYDDIKSAVSGLIKFHEDRIEKLKKNIEDNPEPNGMYEFDRICDEERIKREKESIKAIEHWLEDVI